jgi:hypothetical protein
MTGSSSSWGSMTVNGTFNGLSGGDVYFWASVDVTSSGQMNFYAGSPFVEIQNYGDITVDGVVADYNGTNNMGSITVSSDGTWYEYGDGVGGTIIGTITY